MKVLIVEDEATVRFINAEVVADAGYEVLEAANADEALAILERADDIQLLFSDIRMPGSMDGVELAQLVHERWPNIRILLTSADTRLRDADVPDDGRFLPKPYKVDALLQKLAELEGAAG